MLLAFFLGAVVGMERTTKQPIAGVRTHMILSASSCLISACGAELIHGNLVTGDATRLAGQILAGIGFIGAGVIISRGVGVMTTAATIFLAAGLGIACGLGFWGFAIVSTVIIEVGLVASEHLFLQEELPGRQIKIVCAKDKTNEVRQLFKGIVRLNALTKKDNLTEMTLHFADLSWAELSKLIAAAETNADIVSIAVLDK